MRLLLPTLALLAATADAQVIRKGLPGGKADSSAQSRAPKLGTIDGFVGDSALNPLQAAEVKILSSNVKVNTGPNGRFRISRVPVGQYVVTVRRAGYHPTSTIVEIVASDTLRVSYTLERGTTLDPVVVTAESRSLRVKEFELRRKQGDGEFMTEEEIRKHNPVYPTELLRRFPSIDVSPSNTNSNGGIPQYFALSKRGTGSFMTATGGGMGYCAMQVYVDGIKMPLPFNLDLLPSPRDLMGIEVYNGPSHTPPQYAGYDSTCGVVLVWTKDG